MWKTKTELSGNYSINIVSNRRNELKKLRLQRIFLKDSEGNHFRICSFANTRDKAGEFYIKLLFPDTRNIPLLTETYGKDLSVKDREILLSGVQEFSYHYYGGVAHFKDNPESPVDRKTGLPTILDYPALHLLRYEVYSVFPFEPHNSSEVADGFVLPLIFDDKPRAFEFVVSTESNIDVVNTENADHQKLYKFNLDDSGVNLFITDGFWLAKPSRPDVLTNIFRYDDPTEAFGTM